ncbi:hypothetical protein CROQUDRAFT_111750 [Cronartium quercuum f. sp. fusiforme G11]|uniref:Uncharacterized protein n=1 Tax=Cronartium quercuum f. sp. fusiforme G11 TaxID=708437 RepID=A0A9P6N7I5_9BASI|nr:hypothetical protein CROQUDRAFT_111750 [Cronartium quercuum f. sp. fusiforme G11]
MFKVVLELMNRRGSMTPVDSPKIQPTVISIHVSHNKVVKTEAKYTVKKPKDLLELLKGISSKEDSAKELLKKLLLDEDLQQILLRSPSQINKWQMALVKFLRSRRNSPPTSPHRSPSFMDLHNTTSIKSSLLFDSPQSTFSKHRFTYTAEGLRPMRRVKKSLQVALARARAIDRATGWLWSGML